MCDRLGISSVKVSSVLNKNNKEFGKKFLLDGNCETCWQSDKSNDNTGWIFNTLMSINEK